MRASAIAIVICAFLSVGCGSDTCPVNAIRHVVVSVSADGLNARDFGPCAESGQCEALCRDTALAMAPYDVGVTDCRRVETDAGIGGTREQITLDITYREYVFCGV
jgi:hypothetical protein